MGVLWHFTIGRRACDSYLLGFPGNHLEEHGWAPAHAGLAMQNWLPIATVGGTHEGKKCLVLIGSSCPLQKAQPRGAKFNATQLISPHERIIEACTGCDARKRPAPQHHGTAQFLDYLQFHVWSPTSILTWVYPKQRDTALHRKVGLQVVMRLRSAYSADSRGT